MNDKNIALSEKINCFIHRHEPFCVIMMMAASSAALFHPFFTVYPLHSTTDELGTIIGAASLAGYDWSGVINRSGYYGFGYYSLFAPLFAMHLSPIIIYRMILIITRILRGSTISGIAYYIGRHYYKFPSKISLIMLSFIVTFPMHPLNFANIINDIVLDIFLWAIILSVCKIAEYVEEPLKCARWIFAYGAFVLWALFLHTRAVVMLIASLIVLLLLSFTKRKKIILFTLLAIPLAILSNTFISIYQQRIWAETGKDLGNATVAIPKNIPINDPKAWKIWFDMIIGHFGVQTLLTGGLFLLAVVVVIKYLINVIINKKMAEIQYINIALAISILSMGAVFAAFITSNWFMGMYETWDTVKAEHVYIYTYKAMCYVRYWNVFSGPFLFTAICLLGKKNYKDCIIKSAAISVILFGAFANRVIPIIQNHGDAASFLATYKTVPDEPVTAQFYYKCILLCALSAIFAILFYCSKKLKAGALLPTIILIVVGYHWANKNFNSIVTDRISNMVLASYEEKCNLEDAGVSIGHIYAYDDREKNTNWYIFSVLQFYFYEYRIEDNYPATMMENDVIITYARNSKIEKDFPELLCYRLDDNEVWYTNIELIGYLPQY